MPISQSEHRASPDFAAFACAVHVDAVIEYCRGQFPRNCGVCEHRYECFEDFLGDTVPLGRPQVYDELELIQSEQLIGTLSMVQCACGTSLAVRCGDIRSRGYLDLLAALARDVERTGLSVSEILQLMRQEIHARCGIRSSGVRVRVCSIMRSR
ncbi:MAG: hypothetical protein OEZ06_29125 [Myxococcales bacterium]|nr:hypothetical protein [Myxococcales bacterium]